MHAETTRQNNCVLSAIQTPAIWTPAKQVGLSIKCLSMSEVRKPEIRIEGGALAPPRDSSIYIYIYMSTVGCGAWVYASHNFCWMLFTPLSQPTHGLTSFLPIHWYPLEIMISSPAEAPQQANSWFPYWPEASGQGSGTPAGESSWQKKHTCWFWKSSVLAERGMQKSLKFYWKTLKTQWKSLTFIEKLYFPSIFYGFW